MAIKHSEHYIAVPPGRAILDAMNDQEFSCAEMAKLLNVSDEYFYDLIEGDAPLTDTIADKLEEIFEIPNTASFWKKREQQYRDKLKLINQENSISILETA